MRLLLIFAIVALAAAQAPEPIGRECFDHLLQCKRYAEEKHAELANQYLQSGRITFNTRTAAVSVCRAIGMADECMEALDEEDTCPPRLKMIAKMFVMRHRPIREFMCDAESSRMEEFIKSNCFWRLLTSSETRRCMLPMTNKHDNLAAATMGRPPQLCNKMADMHKCAQKFMASNAGVCDNSIVSMIGKMMQLVDVNMCQRMLDVAQGGGGYGENGRMKSDSGPGMPIERLIQQGMKMMEQLLAGEMEGSPMGEMVLKMVKKVHMKIQTLMMKMYEGYNSATQQDYPSEVRQGALEEQDSEENEQATEQEMQMYEMKLRAFGAVAMKPKQTQACFQKSCNPGRTRNTPYGEVQDVSCTESRSWTDVMLAPHPDALPKDAAEKRAHMNMVAKLMKKKKRLIKRHMMMAAKKMKEGGLNPMQFISALSTIKMKKMAMKKMKMMMLKRVAKIAVKDLELSHKCSEWEDANDMPSPPGDQLVWKRRTCTGSCKISFTKMAKMGDIDVAEFHELPFLMMPSMPGGKDKDNELEEMLMMMTQQ